MSTTDLQSRKRSLRHMSLLVIALTAVATYVISGGIITAVGGGSSISPGERGMIAAAGADRYPSATALDWATYADHVVVATVEREALVEPSADEIERGEGLLLRNLSMSVTEVVWSSPLASTPAPAEFDWRALGWHFTTDPEYKRTAMTGDDEPRLEVGHTYIIAIEKPDRACVDPESENAP